MENTEVMLNITSFPLLFLIIYLNKFNIYSYILRHCATRRKVAGLFPDGGIGIFQAYNPSDRILSLEFTQSLTQISEK